ncbi:MAG: DUF1761 domain-containing protein [Myxococcales bacterium]
MSINLLAVVAAALCSFLLGGPWYSDLLFKKAWMREAGRDAAALEKGSGKQKHPAYVFGVSFVFALIAAFVFALWLGPNPPLGYALQRGLLAGAGLVATMFGINYLFSARSMVLWAIDAGYHVVQFVLFGLVLGLWH